MQALFCTSGLRATSSGSLQASCLRSQRLSVNSASFNPHRPMQLFPLMIMDQTETHAHTHTHTHTHTHKHTHTHMHTFGILGRLQINVKATGEILMFLQSFCFLSCMEKASLRLKRSLPFRFFISVGVCVCRWSVVMVSVLGQQPCSTFV